MVIHINLLYVLENNLGLKHSDTCLHSFLFCMFSPAVTLVFFALFLFKFKALGVGKRMARCSYPHVARNGFHETHGDDSTS